MPDAADRWKAARERHQKALREFADAEIELTDAGKQLLIEIEGENHKVSPRERDVLNMVRDRKSNKEIAALLNVSERTIKFHVSSLLRKYRVDARRYL